jgi:hypothetical protein
VSPKAPLNKSRLAGMLAFLRKQDKYWRSLDHHAAKRAKELRTEIADCKEGDAGAEARSKLTKELNSLATTEAYLCRSVPVICCCPPLTRTLCLPV